ncbi:MAG TPA: DUF3667 domain-containing protein [Steroidobacteraceae bacterium]|nr:DUF3667 domain-containing protein [Steroidobacteraceae bacterium]
MPERRGVPLSDLPVPSPPAAPPVPVVSLPEPPAPQTLVCANCGQSLAGEYCAACGQRHEPHVHTVGHFAGEAFESISHADSRLWRTLLYLLIRPGFLTREFFAGRRVRYLPPFRLYLVISVLFFVVIGLGGGDKDEIEIAKPKTAEDVAAFNAVADQFAAKKFGPMSEEQSAKVAAQLRAIAAKQAAEIEAKQAAKDGKVPAAAGATGAAAKPADDADDKDVNLMTGEGVENGISQFCADFSIGDAKDPTPKNANRKSVSRWCKRFSERGASAVGEAIAHNIPRAMFVFLPLLALCMKALYWRPKRYYVEHLLFLIHNHAFVFLTMAIVMLIGMIPFVGDYAWPVYWAAFFYMAWYIYRAMRNVYGQGRALTLAKYFTLFWVYFFAGFGVFLLTAIYSAMTF